MSPPPKSPKASSSSSSPAPPRQGTTAVRNSYFSAYPERTTYDPANPVTQGPKLRLRVVERNSNAVGTSGSAGGNHNGHNDDEDDGRLPISSKMKRMVENSGTSSLPPNFSPKSSSQMLEGKSFPTIGGTSASTSGSGPGSTSLLNRPRPRVISSGSSSSFPSQTQPTPLSPSASSSSTTTMVPRTRRISASSSTTTGTATSAAKSSSRPPASSSNKTRARPSPSPSRSNPSTTATPSTSETPLSHSSSITHLAKPRRDFLVPDPRKVVTSGGGGSSGSSHGGNEKGKNKSSSSSPSSSNSNLNSTRTSTNNNNNNNNNDENGTPVASLYATSNSTTSSATTSTSTLTPTTATGSSGGTRKTSSGTLSSVPIPPIPPTPSTSNHRNGINPRSPSHERSTVSSRAREKEREEKRRLKEKNEKNEEAKKKKNKDLLSLEKQFGNYSLTGATAGGTGGGGSGAGATGAGGGNNNTINNNNSTSGRVRKESFASTSKGSGTGGEGGGSSGTRSSSLATAGSGTGAGAGAGGSASRSASKTRESSPFASGHASVPTTQTGSAKQFPDLKGKRSLPPIPSSSSSTGLLSTSTPESNNSFSNSSGPISNSSADLSNNSTFLRKGQGGGGGGSGPGGKTRHASSPASTTAKGITSSISAPNFHSPSSTSMEPPSLPTPTTPTSQPQAQAVVNPRPRSSSRPLPKPPEITATPQSTMPPMSGSTSASTLGSTSTPIPPIPASKPVPTPTPTSIAPAPTSSSLSSSSIPPTTTTATTTIANSTTNRRASAASNFSLPTGLGDLLETTANGTLGLGLEFDIGALISAGNSEPPTAASTSTIRPTGSGTSTLRPSPQSPKFGNDASGGDSSSSSSIPLPHSKSLPSLRQQQQHQRGKGDKTPPIPPSPHDLAKMRMSTITEVPSNTSGSTTVSPTSPIGNGGESSSQTKRMSELGLGVPPVPALPSASGSANEPLTGGSNMIGDFAASLDASFESFPTEKGSSPLSASSFSESISGGKGKEPEKESEHSRRTSLEPSIRSIESMVGSSVSHHQYQSTAPPPRPPRRIVSSPLSQSQPLHSTSEFLPQSSRSPSQGPTRPPSSSQSNVTPFPTSPSALKQRPPSSNSYRPGTASSLSQSAPPSRRGSAQSPSGFGFPFSGLKKKGSRESSLAGTDFGNSRPLTADNNNRGGRSKKTGSVQSHGGGSVRSDEQLGSDYDDSGSAASDAKVLEDLFQGPTMGQAGLGGGVSVTSMDKMVEALRDGALGENIGGIKKKQRRRERDKERERERQRQFDRERERQLLVEMEMQYRRENPHEQFDSDAEEDLRQEDAGDEELEVVSAKTKGSGPPHTTEHHRKTLAARERGNSSPQTETALTDLTGLPSVSGGHENGTHGRHMTSPPQATVQKLRGREFSASSLPNSTSSSMSTSSFPTRQSSLPRFGGSFRGDSSVATTVSSGSSFPPMDESPPASRHLPLPYIPRVSSPVDQSLSQLGLGSEIAYGDQRDEKDGKDPTTSQPKPKVIIPSLDEIIRNRVVDSMLPKGSIPASLLNTPTDVATRRHSFTPPASPGTPQSTKSTIPSIEEIISKHAEPASGRSTPRSRRRSLDTRSLNLSTGHGSASHDWRNGRISEEDEDRVTRSSIDSVTQEAKESASNWRASRELHHSKSFPERPSRPGTGTDSHQHRSFTSPEKGLPAVPSNNLVPPLPALPTTTTSTKPLSEADLKERQIAEYLRSPRLTRLLNLRHPPNHKLTVSLADIGSSTGHPVIVFLGLGCVRYLVGLYDEMAEVLGLRLVCVDRWGLGRTSEIEDNRRGFLEWASVIEEVADQLELDHFSILAHSAGAPYALACALRMQSRIRGSIHLLAPWVGLDEMEASQVGSGVGYKWRKFVPNGVIRTAQAAEWKMQAWKLGKAPKWTPEGVGYDKKAGLGSERYSDHFSHGRGSESRPSVAPDSEFDDDWDDLASVLSGGTSKTKGSNRTKPSSVKGGVGGGLLGNVFGPTNGSSKNPLKSRSRTSSSNQRPPSLQIPSEPPHHSSGLDSLPSALKKASWGKSSSRSFTSPRSSIRSSSPPPLPASFLSSSLPPSNTNGSTPASAANSPAPPSSGEIGTALLRASHSESLRGGTADLLAILGKTAKPFGFSYQEVAAPVRVWHGTDDERIGMNAIKWMEKEMADCKVTVVEGADHGLMMNARVVVEALESIADGH